MKKYPDNSEIYELKKKRRKEIEQLPPIERIKISKRLQRIGQLVPKQADSKTRDPNWSIASGRQSKTKRKIA